MKRSPLKRGQPLRRGKALTPDPEKVREFIQRGRAASARSLSSGRSGFRRSESPEDAARWRKAVYAASAGRCMITGTRARDVDDRRYDAHHPIPKRELRKRGLFEHVWDPRNGMWLHRRVHGRHESGFKRIPREALPSRVWEFALELNELVGTEWATELLKRTHPIGGGSDGS